MHYLSGLVVYENVGGMSIAQSEYVADNGSSCHASGIVQSHREPGHRRLMFLGEVVPHDRFELGSQLNEPFDNRVGVLAPLSRSSRDSSEGFDEFFAFQVVGTVSRHQV